MGSIPFITGFLLHLGVNLSKPLIQMGLMNRQLNVNLHLAEFIDDDDFRDIGVSVNEFILVDKYLKLGLQSRYRFFNFLIDSIKKTHDIKTFKDILQ